MADSDAVYLRQALPVLVAYTRQVVLAVDVERMHAVAEEAGLPADQVAFLAAMRDFQRAVRGLLVDEGVLP
ncbi:hypothetical protein FHS43_006202 [Streptosporangium becharense]|uniref:Uncharacterized protein n=1 Tax=Streptosporangium becharense TaxID=1816182 RepID=A0A7W9IHT1_9ACTN|nr:hypothetical protein [Streptosporangium becharense]MBB2914890.1 hypothetical protein [Streptosporangium becharense]MBB5820299.1 hypothetical protein [Streptosporangium becharense]